MAIKSFQIGKSQPVVRVGKRDRRCVMFSLSSLYCKETYLLVKRCHESLVGELLTWSLTEELGLKAS